ncbi:MAG: HAMP domain-containing protein, partial [Synergistaceae bacterium]|nr:HAMP domain-containing protein [Synergistaceae bacterium]
MSLRIKTIVWIVAIFSVSLIAMNLVFRVMTLEEFAKVEVDFAARAVERLDACFDYENNIYRLNAGLWGHRADIYEYMDNRDFPLIHEAVNPELLRLSNTDFFMLLDPFGNVVFEMTLDPEGRERPLSYAERKAATQLIPNLEEISRHGEIAGLFALGRESYEIGIASVAPSPLHPVRGYCIVGTRTIERIRNIASAFQESLDVYHVFETRDYPPEIESALARAIAATDPFIVETTPDVLKVWVPQRDILGKGNIVAMFSQPRTIYMRGLSAVTEANGVMILTGAIALFAVTFILNLLLKRMVRLRRAALNITNNAISRTRLPVEGNDELSDLERALNASVSATEDIFDNMPFPIVLADMEERIVAVNRQ